jgi:hypothetical protein
MLCNKATAQIGTNVRPRVLNADCWLEVSLHPEGPATGQLDQGFPRFTLTPPPPMYYLSPQPTDILFPLSLSVNS